MVAMRAILVFVGFTGVGLVFASQPPKSLYAATRRPIITDQDKLLIAAVACRRGDYVMAYAEYQGVIDAAHTTSAKIVAYLGLGKISLGHPYLFSEAYRSFKKAEQCAGNKPEFSYLAGIAKSYLLTLGNEDLDFGEQTRG